MSKNEPGKEPEVPTQQGTPYVLPIYDTMIDRAIASVQTAYSSQVADNFWNALKGLVVAIREPEPRKKLDDFVLTTEREILALRSTYDYTVAESFVKAIRINRIRMDKGLMLMDQCFKFLDESGYFIRRGKQVQSNVRKSQLFQTET